MKLFKKMIEVKINPDNSTLGVRCNCGKLCGSRFTALCEICKHNCGMKKEDSYYKKK